MSTEFFHSALLVEDERNLATALKIALKQLGIPSRHVPTLAAAREELRESPAELLVLDRALPDGDGVTLCEELREGGYEGTILMLTAAAQTHERVHGLNSGADDYLGKPFSWDELAARVRALARRKRTLALHPVKSETLWSLDTDRLRILGPNGWTVLTPLEFKLASRLISARGAIVTRDHLLKDVWGFNFLPKTRTVDHFLGRLRKRFEKNLDEPRHFITVRGAGYRFTP
jgi:DNA-binding response OmpR family regulator